MKSLIRTGAGTIHAAMLAYLRIAFCQDVLSGDGNMSRDDIMAKLRELLKKRLAGTEDDTVVVVESHHRHTYVVNNTREAMHVWDEWRIDHAYLVRRVILDGLRSSGLEISPVYNTKK